MQLIKKCLYDIYAISFYMHVSANGLFNFLLIAMSNNIININIPIYINNCIAFKLNNKLIIFILIIM